MLEKLKTLIRETLAMFENYKNLKSEAEEAEKRIDEALEILRGE